MTTEVVTINTTLVAQGTSTQVVAVTEHETVIVDGASDRATIVVTGQIGPAGPKRITGSDDLDVSNLEDGATIVYDTSTSKWVATKSLSKQTIEGGQY